MILSFSFQRIIILNINKRCRLIYDSSKRILFILFYNNKIMIAAQENRADKLQSRPGVHSQYRKPGRFDQRVNQETKSINISANLKHQPTEDDNQNNQQIDLKSKRPKLNKSLFTDYNFRCEAKKSSQTHSYLQILRNLPRRTYESSNIKVLLKTEYSVIHNLIHKYFNFKFYNKEDQYSDLFLIWIDSYVSEQFVKRLKSYQRINHFPSSCQLGRKDLLAINLNNAKANMPQLYQFYPKTWVLPRDYESFNQKDSDSFYIIKPHANCQGRGIYLTKSPNLTLKDEVIVQQYIQNPMLIDGCKFDLRVYVMLRSLDPLRIYVYEEGLCRLATAKYSKPNQGNFKNEKMHLTNYAINKLSPNFVGNSSIKDDNKGHKRSLTSTLKNLLQMGFDTDKIKQRIDSIIIRSILAAYTKMLQSYKKTRQSNINFKNLKEFANFKQQHKHLSHDNTNQQSVCFQLFGFDIMLLETGQPILLEINHQPSLVTDSPLDLNIKRSLILDTINILNLNEQDKNLWQKNQIDAIPYKRLHIQQKQLENKGGYRRIYPLNHIKIHEKTQQQASKIQRYIESYQQMIIKIMFRQFKRLSKLKMINYKTITYRNNRTLISKFSQEDSDRANTSAPKTSDYIQKKYQDQKSIALTFYNLFNDSNYNLTKEGFKRAAQRQSETELQQKVIKNHVLLQSIDNPSTIKKERQFVQKRTKRNNHQLIDLKGKYRREQFNIRKHQTISSKVPQFFLDKESSNTDEKSITQSEKISNMMRLNLLSSKNKGVIHYISTNKSKKELQQRIKTPGLVQFTPIYSTVANRHAETSQKSQRKNIKQRNQINLQVDRTKTSQKNRGQQSEQQYEYREIYGNSIKQKMEKINNLKIIKNNLHKLHFINFVERTKGLRKVIESLYTEQQQKSHSMNK